MTIAAASATRRDLARTIRRNVLDHYTRQSAFSTPGRHARLLDSLPGDPAGVARVIQGLVIYEHVAEPFYGCPLTEDRRAESHIRPVEAIIDAILALDGRPLDIARPPQGRLVGICRHYMLLAVAMLRHHGVPARGRGGFGAYFNPGKFEDHWLCEYWNAEEGRWALLDPQFDRLWLERFDLRHDIHDVPRDRFLTAPAAWRKCREGALDADDFGIGFSNLRGLWFVAGSVARDLAALCGGEVLPWDVWGMIPPHEMVLSKAQLAAFDEIALLTADPDANLDAMRQRFADDADLRLPDTVFNALRQREESLF